MHQAPLHRGILRMAVAAGLCAVAIGLMLAALTGGAGHSTQRAAAAGGCAEPAGDDGGNPAGVPVIRSRDVTAVQQLPHDLRRPRPPRHRSERPTTGLAVVGEAIMPTLIEFLDDLPGGRLVPFPAALPPLAGHPSAILRPPAPRG